MPSERTVLITGATGNIGMKLRRHFEAQGGYSLRLLCLNPAGDRSVMTADLAIYDDSWAAQFDDVDAVIHLAGDPRPNAPWESIQRANIDLMMNVLRAAERGRARRVIFASSNWTMAGYRFADVRLTTDLPPWPINPYGESKLFGERVGLALSQRTGISFIAFRIGYCQRTEGNRPGPHMGWGSWGQLMWLSDRDLCQAMERAVTAENVPFAVLNLMSDNPGMRWDIETTRKTIGYAPQDGQAATLTDDIVQQEETARLNWELSQRLGQMQERLRG